MNKIILIIFILIVSQSESLATCKYSDSSTLTTKYLQMPSLTNLQAVNGAIFPHKLTDTTANITDQTWYIQCTNDVTIQPILTTYRDPYSANTKYQTTDTSKSSAPTLIFRMSYPDPVTNDLIYFTGKSGDAVKTPNTLFFSANTRITATDLQLNRLTMENHQAKILESKHSWNWGKAGGLNNLYFDLTENEGTTNSIRFNVYIAKISFKVGTCSIPSTTVNLGSVTASDFTGNQIGDVMNTPKEFKIILQCDSNVTVNYSINDVSNTSSNSNLGLVSLDSSSSADGYAIQLKSKPFNSDESVDYTTVTLGSKIQSSNKSTGNGISDYIAFSAGYYRTKKLSDAKSGAANGSVTITLSYQ